MSRKILVVGSFVVDMVAQVDAFPKEGQTIIGKELKKYPGGKGANQCVQISRLGGQVEMAGKLGCDENGRMMRTVFSEEKIPADCILHSEHSPTAVGLIQINGEGENKIVVIPGANYDYSLEDLSGIHGKIREADFVLTQLELQHEVTFELIRVCHQEGVKLMLNPAPAVAIPDEILSMVHTITPNETELSIITGKPCKTMDEIFEACQHLLSLGIKNVVATLGKRGAVIANGDGIEQVPGYKVYAVDTVAAGDSFNGALVKSMVDGMSLKEAVRYANGVAALTVQKEGAIPSLPRKEDVEMFMKAEVKQC